MPLTNVAITPSTAAVARETPVGGELDEPRQAYHLLPNDLAHRKSKPETALIRKLRGDRSAGGRRVSEPRGGRPVKTTHTRLVIRVMTAPQEEFHKESAS
jgi:hypothetical protein